MKHSTLTPFGGMGANYLKIAFRNLIRNKVYTSINVFGLAIGIATCLIIVLYIQNELSYDKFNEKAKRIVRVGFKGKMGGEAMNEAAVMPPVAQALKSEFPEIQTATRIKYFRNIEKISFKEKTFRESKIAYVDANLFDVFTIPFLKGNAKTALVAPNTIVISQEMATKYFGNEDPIGKILNFKNNNVSYAVTGLFDKIPENSHFHFDFLASMANIAEANQTTWLAGSYFTYILLPEGYDYKQLENKMPAVVDKYIGPELKQAMGMDLSQFRQKGDDVGLYLQPLTDIHLHSSSTSEIESNGDIQYVYIFGAIALFMLIIACINFMNLSTASSSKRAKEVGIRKVLGSVRQELILQFLIESIVLATMALVISLGLVYLMLPLFNQLVNKNLSIDFIENPATLFALLAFGLFVGIFAGSYPAFFLSSFKPITMLKTNGSTIQNVSKSSSFNLRSGLVIFQFCVSVILIIGTLIVHQQLTFIQNKKLGYEKEQIIVLRNTWALGDKESVYKAQILSNPNVVNVSNSAFLPAGNTDDNLTSTFPSENKSLIRRTHIYLIDEQYIPTMGMQMKLGRNFSKAFTTDSTAVIINESLAKLYGWNLNAIGKSLNILSDNNGHSTHLQVIGVVKDFHYKSLHKEIEPLMMVLQKSSGLIVKAKTQNVQELIASLKTQWESFKVDEPFNYTFLDDDFNKIYISEQNTGFTLSIFSGLTIFIACLGLFGLATFTAEQRTKEIGIRKVLGASVTNIIQLLSIDFIKLVLIAIVIATPIAYFIMTRWLQDFAYRININWFVFIISGLCALIIALFTISYQSIRAALMNPVNSLNSK